MKYFTLVSCSDGTHLKHLRTQICIMFKKAIAMNKIALNVYALNAEQTYSILNKH